MAAKTDQEKWEERNAVLLGGAVSKAEEAPIKDQPPEDGGPVRRDKDKPFVRDPELVEADHTTPPVADEDKGDG